MVLSLMVVLSLACSQESDQADQAQISRDKESLAAQAAAEALIGRYEAALKRELITALAAEGPVAAISVCSEKAPALTEMFSRGGLLTIRRVSDRYRNPANAADPELERLIEQFKATPRDPDLTHSVWSERTDGHWFSYRKAIRTELPCLRCHGDQQGLAEGVAEVLAQRYPADRATGYAPREIRGLFVVEMKWPDAAEFVAARLRDSL
jgi:hypothetical protein